MEGLNSVDVKIGDVIYVPVNVGNKSRQKAKEMMDEIAMQYQLLFPQAESCGAGVWHFLVCNPTACPPALPPYGGLLR